MTTPPFPLSSFSENTKDPQVKTSSMLLGSNPSSATPCCVTLGWSFHFFVPQYPFLGPGMPVVLSHRGRLWITHSDVCKALGTLLACRKHSIGLSTAATIAALNLSPHRGASLPTCPFMAHPCPLTS